MRRNSAKLSRRYKAWLYTVTLVIYMTGAAWGWLHYLAPRPDELALHSPLEPWLMKLHGAGAMALLVLLGTLLPGHVRFAWHAHRNRPNGIMLISVFAFLILTGHGLYYFGDERLRSWTSSLHLVVGLALPLALILHILSGRRSDVALSRRQPQTTDLVGESRQL
jgi:hypothetical protein